MNLLLYSFGSAMIDILALGIIFLITFLSVKQGFIKSLVSTLGTIFSLLFAVLLCSTVVSFVERKFAYVSSVSNWLGGFIDKIFGKEVMEQQVSLVSKQSLSNGGLSSFIAQLVLSVAAKAEISPAATVKEIICPVFAYYIVFAISFICLFILFKIIFFILGDLSKKLQKIKIIGPLNKTLGGIFGFIKSVFIIDVVLIIINAIPLGLTQSISLAFSNTILVSFLSKINFISILFETFSSSGVVSYITNSI